MPDVRFEPVNYDDLSAIRHEVSIAEHERFASPEFLLIRYFGAYKPGSEGRDDATYIRATLAAARTAWWAEATILDFSGLEYVWGDEMEGVASDGEGPLMIVVGNKCRGALQSLLMEDYDRFCVDTIDEAVERCRASRR